MIVTLSSYIMVKINQNGGVSCRMKHVSMQIDLFVEGRPGQLGVRHLDNSVTLGLNQYEMPLLTLQT